MVWPCDGEPSGLLLLGGTVSEAPCLHTVLIPSIPHTHTGDTGTSSGTSNKIAKLNRVQNPTGMHHIA